MLVLDDVHWADAASVELLAALLRSPPDAAVLVVLAARPRQWPDRLATAIERADRQGDLTRLALAGLPREAAGELLGDQVGRERADALYEEAGGNPFYLLQLARSDGAAAGGSAPIAALEAVGVPAAVIASLGEELALLSDDTRRVLRGAAVAGDPFEPELAAAAAGADEPTAMDGVRRAAGPRPGARAPRSRGVFASGIRSCAARCTRACPAAGCWVPMSAARRSWPRAAPGRWRGRITSSSPARHGDPAAVAVLTEAGTATLLRAPASAARWFSAALRLLPDDSPAEQRVELLLARARALAAQGRLAESHADILECIALAPADARRSCACS